MDNEDILSVRNLFKNFKENYVVNDLSINISPGEIVGLLGPNGAGKTTTFYIILGLIEATKGNVFLGEEDITDLAMYQRARLGIGYLPQDSSVFRKLSVANNLIAVAQILPISKKEMVNRVDQLLHEFRLNDKRNQIAYTLSGGEEGA